MVNKTANTFSEIEEVLNIVDNKAQELLDTFDNLLNKRGVKEADDLVRKYQVEVSQAPNGRLTNDQINYYRLNFGHTLYILGASLSRQGLASDLASMHYDTTSATAFLGATGDGTRKLTREDKAAEATMRTQSEQVVKALFARVAAAVEQRIRSLNTIVRTLETSATMNMSEARLGGQ